MSEFNKYRLKGAYHHDWYQTEDWYRWMVDKAVEFCQGGTVDLGGGDGLVASKLLAKQRMAIVLDSDPEAGSLCFSQKIPFVLINVDEWPWDVTFDKTDYPV